MRDDEDAIEPADELADEHEQLEAESARIETLLSELRELVPLPAWQRIEDVLRGIVRLYAAGIARSLDHARATGADPAWFDARLCADELLASLLVLHGLHPLPAEQRIARALGPVRRELGLPEHALAITAIRDGVVHLAVNAVLGGGGMSEGLAEGMIRRVIETAAPEITSVELGGVVRRDPSLVQLRTSRPTR